MKGDFHLDEPIEAPNYTQVPHLFLRTLMAQCSGAEFKVLTHMCDETWGYHREDRFVPMSIASISRATGVARSAVQNAVYEFERCGLVESHVEVSKQNGTETKLFRLRVRRPNPNDTPVPPTGKGVSPTGGPLPVSGNGVPVSGNVGVPVGGRAPLPVGGSLIKKGYETKREINTSKQNHVLGAADAAAGVQEKTGVNEEARSPTDEGGGGGRQLVLIEEVRVTKDPMKEQEPKKARAAKKAKETTHSSSSVGEQEEKLPQGRHKGAVREGMEHQEGESPEDFAAREYLARVRGWTSCGRPVYVRWRLDLAPVVQETGTDGFSDWITWLISDPWYKENAYKLRPARLLQEFDDWWNLPEPRPLRRKSWAPKRDDGRVENNESRVEERFVCVACNGELGTRHQDFCTLVKRGVVRAGSPITREHCDEKWAIPVLHDSRRRGAI